jgi:hypothetical protein
MNYVNAIKTAILASGLLATLGPYLLNGFMKLFGCEGDNPVTPDVIEVARCTGGGLFTIPETFQVVAGGLVAAAALALTAWFKTGSVMQNLFNKSVPVVTEKVAAEMSATKPTGAAGVVTEAQVAEKA